MSQDRQYQDEQQIIKIAKQKADKIVKEAEDIAKTIYAASLEYVDDMLAEVELVALRAKENMRVQHEFMMSEFDTQINIINQHKRELLYQLQELYEDGQKPIKKASYHIKIDESYIPRKQSYEIKSNGVNGETVEVHKADKMPYKIKVSDRWKQKVDEVTQVSKYSLLEESKLPKVEVEEEDGFKASDFDLDAEYFAWLEEEKKKK